MESTDLKWSFPQQCWKTYLNRKESGRGLISLEDCVRQEEASLRTYVCGSGEWMLKVVADMGVVSEMVTAQEYKNQACI